MCAYVPTFWKRAGCALIGACALIRTNTVYLFLFHLYHYLLTMVVGPQVHVRVDDMSMLAPILFERRILNVVMMFKKMRYSVCF